MLFRDIRPYPHMNPTSPGPMKALTDFARSGVSANVLLDELAYRDMRAAKAQISALINTGKAMDANQAALLGAI